MLKEKLFNNIPDYHFPDSLRDAVRVAHKLKMPLLLTGKPGTGKTTAAKAIAAVLGKEKGVPFFTQTFNTKSISVFKDLLYTYDQLLHFADVQLNERKPIKEYITYNVLGKAIIAKDPDADAELKKEFSDFENVVILIDEIDKAPRDFPNDLLNTLDKFEFEVKELNKTYKMEKMEKTDETDKKNLPDKPFIVLTSNSEKGLPDAFLRRCIFFHIDFPKGETLKKILLKQEDLKNLSDKTIQTLETWLKKAQDVVIRKNIGTAEFIAWAKFLQENQMNLDTLEFGKLPENPEQADNLLMSFSILAKTEGDFKDLRDKHK